MRLVHLSDIHIWHYSVNPLKLWGKRAVVMAELFAGRARKFRLEHLANVVARVEELQADHILITGDLTTTALRGEFEEARSALAPLLKDPERVSVIPGNHDRLTNGSVRARRFEGFFGEYAPSTSYPWVREVQDHTVILALDATRSHVLATGRLPEEQLRAAEVLLESMGRRPRRLIVACHYPIAAPGPYRSELHRKRMINAPEVAAWLRRLGPHLYCCGHIHAAWAFRPEEVPEQLSLNAGAPLFHGPTGRRPPGFLEIEVAGHSVSVRHHAWTGADWSVIPLVSDLSLFGRNVEPPVRDSPPPSRAARGS